MRRECDAACCSFAARSASVAGKLSFRLCLRASASKARAASSSSSNWPRFLVLPPSLVGLCHERYSGRGSLPRRHSGGSKRRGLGWAGPAAQIIRAPKLIALIIGLRHQWRRLADDGCDRILLRNLTGPRTSKQFVAGNDTPDEEYHTGQIELDEVKLVVLNGKLGRGLTQLGLIAAQVQGADGTRGARRQNRAGTRSDIHRFGLRMTIFFEETLSTLPLASVTSTP